MDNNKIKREVEIGDRVLKFYEHEGLDDSVAGAWTWDCSLVMAHWLQHATSQGKITLSGKSVVEIGAGTGIPGITAASLGAKVVLTDIPELMPGLLRNINANLLSHSVSFHSLRWGNGEDLNSLGNNNRHVCIPPDFIIMSDVIYDIQSTALLCWTLESIAGSETEIYVAYELRFGTTDCFKVLRQHGFRWSKLPPEELHPLWQSDDIAIFRLFRESS